MEDGNQKKETMRTIISLICGCIFAIAWFIWIDANVYSGYYNSNHEKKIPKILFYYYIPGILGTLGLIMTNLVSTEFLDPYSWFFDETISTKVKLWLFISFTISFGSIAASIWIAVAIFMPPHNQATQYPGIALIVQNLLIFFSSLLFFWIRSRKYDYEEI